MKKVAIFPLALLLALTLFGCANNNDTTNKNGNGTNEQNSTTENNGGNGSANGNNNGNNTDTNGNGANVEVADDAAEQITAMEEVSTANVLVTDQNAYVGVALKEGVKENDELKQKIADQVRQVHSEFNNVYVSFNPDVAERLTEYGNQIRSGEPVEGFIDEFTTSINRMFPEAK